MKLSVFALVSLLGIGCTSGYYTMYVPDQVAAVNGRFIPVARLMRNEILNYHVPQPTSPLRFQIIKPGDFDPAIAIGLEKAARTDENGYAGVSIRTLLKPCYNKPGKYILQVSLQDSEEGEEVIQRVRAFLWNPATPVVVVDMDVLPLYDPDQSLKASRAIQNISKTANVVYFTRSPLPNQAPNHAMLKELGYPDGPILIWELRHWKTGKIGTIVEMPTVYLDEHLVNQLPQLRKQFPLTKLGITTDPVAAEAFEKAGLKSLLIANENIAGKGYMYRFSWDDLNNRIPPECKKTRAGTSPEVKPKPVTKQVPKPNTPPVHNDLGKKRSGDADLDKNAKPVPIKISD